MTSIEKGFAKASSGNLPCVDMEMVAEFIRTSDGYVGAEMRGVKATRAGRESYGDDAIGYVQVQRSEQICIVRARVTPEHRVRSKCYNVALHVDEAEPKIAQAVCEDCAASTGGCKHAIALLMWVHRRSEDPAPTSVECYWKKSRLSTVGTALKFVTASDLAPNKKKKTSQEDPTPEEGKLFLDEVLKEGGSCQGQLFQHFREMCDEEYLALSNLSYCFAKSGGDSYENFITFCKSHMTDERVIKAEKCTRSQSLASLWHKLRFGRVTASKVLETARCRTEDGSLVEALLGAKIPDNDAMERGRRLEPLVLAKAASVLGHTLQPCGLFLSSETPLLGASPDAISKDFVVEVKCPAKLSTMKNYVNKGKPTEKCNAQIQLQMHLTKRSFGYLCVAHPDFENTKNVDILKVDYDAEYIIELITGAMCYWEKVIFPKLMIH